MGNRSEQGVFVFCLCIDLIGSTATGINLTSHGLNKFNVSLIKQIQPHLDSVGLGNALLKFTGDGWLVMTDGVEQIPSLCCLAIIMVNRFQDEMSGETGISKDKIPALRIGVCSGRDITVQLPDGSSDWVGDSARRAVRASKVCKANQVVIDDTVRSYIFRDFVTEALDSSVWGQAEKAEEKFALHLLENINSEVATDLGPLECFVNTLSILGRSCEASSFARRFSEDLENKANKAASEDKKVILSTWNRLLASRLNYQEIVRILNDIRDVGLDLDVMTYNILIDKSPDYSIARDWLKQLRNEGIEPDVVSYNILINKSPDYLTARDWLNQMRDEGIEPNVVSYNTFINKSPDYLTARNWLNQMRDEGIKPDVVSYNTLINKSPDYLTARDWLERMRDEGIEPNVVSYNTLVKKAPDYQEVLEYMLDDKLTPTAAVYIAAIRKSPDFDTVEKMLERMRENDVMPTLDIYLAAIQKCPDFIAAEKILERMREDGIEPDFNIYSALINK